MASQESVPYFVLLLDGDQSKSSCHRAKALFTVPEELAVSLSAHPIMCRGSSFALELDEAAMPSPSSNSSSSNKTATTFLSTVFESPRPEDLAQEISRRLAVRIDHVGSFQIGGGGGRGAAAAAGEILGLF